MRWELVGCDRHPVPDDPSVIEDSVAHLRAVARTIRQQVERMPTAGKVDELVWDSDGATEFRTIVKKLPKDLKVLETRYDKVAAALETYAKTVRSTCARAEAAVARAERAQEEIDAAEEGEKRVAEYRREAERAAARINQSAPAGTPPVQPQPWTGPNYAATKAVAQRLLETARRDARDAVGDFKEATRRTAAAVAAASNDSLKDAGGWWNELMRDVTHKARWLVERLPLKEIAALAGKIAAVAGLLALIPGLQWLAVVALAASIVAFIADGALMIDKAARGQDLTGDDWFTLGLDAIGVVTGVSGVRAFFKGAAAAKATRAAIDAEAEAASVARRVASLRASRSATKLDDLRAGSVNRFVNWITGRTGRAGRQLAQAQDELAAAARREAQALEAQRHIAKAADAARRQAEAEVFSPGLRRVGDVADVVDLARDIHERDLEPIARVNPGAAVLVSAAQDVNGIIEYWAHGYDPSNMSSVGNQIDAQPIR